MFGSVLLRPQHNSNWKVTATWLLIGQGRKLQDFAAGASNPWPGATRYPISAEYCVPPRSSSFSIALYVPAKLTNPQTFIIILALLYKPHAHSWLHWRSSTAQGYKHYFYYSEEEAAPELQGPWTVGQKRKSGAGTTPRKGLWSGGARPLPTLPQPGAFPDNPPALDSRAAVTFPRGPLSRNQPPFTRLPQNRKTTAKVRVPACNPQRLQDKATHLPSPQGLPTNPNRDLSG